MCRCRVNRLLCLNARIIVQYYIVGHLNKVLSTNYNNGYERTSKDVEFKRLRKHDDTDMYLTTMSLGCQEC